MDERLCRWVMTLICLVFCFTSGVGAALTEKDGLGYISALMAAFTVFGGISVITLEEY